MFSKVLIANRGVAVRIERTLAKMGVKCGCLLKGRQGQLAR